MFSPESNCPDVTLQHQSVAASKVNVFFLFLPLQVAPLCVGRAGACVVAVKL